jgi:hypothetical protein
MSAEQVTDVILALLAWCSGYIVRCIHERVRR